METGTYDAQDRLLEYGGATYSYTANGELTEKVEGADTTGFAYDVFGNLTRVDLPDGTVIEYVIDGRNRRVGKKVDGVLVQGFLYGDQLNPVAELDGAGNVVSRFIYGSKANVPDYVARGGETFRVLSDHLGSVRMVVNVATGAVVQRLSYDAWGRLLEDTNPGWQPFGFAGGVWEAGTGLVRFGARDYSPTTGRWTIKDPIGIAGGDANLYGYLFGNSVNHVDPNGMVVWAPVIVGAVAGGIWGGISAAVSGSGSFGDVVAGVVSGATIGATTALAPAHYLLGTGAAALGGAAATAIGKVVDDLLAGCRPSFDRSDWLGIAASGASYGVGAAAGFGSIIGAGGSEAVIQSSATIIGNSWGGALDVVTQELLFGGGP